MLRTDDVERAQRGMCAPFCRAKFVLAVLGLQNMLDQT
jgi:hypothetical protein